MVAWETTETDLFGIGAFVPHNADYRLVNLLLAQRLSGQELESALGRLCEVATTNGCLAVRSALATYGGLTPDDVDAFTKAVAVPLDREMDPSALAQVIGMAREARDSGNYSGYTALAASVGYYPPEYSDTLSLDPLSQVANIHGMSITLAVDNLSVL